MFADLPSVSFGNVCLSLFLAVTWKNDRLLYDFGSPKECKRARHQKSVSVFLFCRRSSDLVVHVIISKGSSVIPFVPAYEAKEQIFRYLLRVSTWLLKARIIQADFEKQIHVWAVVFESVHTLQGPFTGNVGVVCLLNMILTVLAVVFLLYFYCLHAFGQICSFLMSEIDIKFN